MSSTEGAASSAAECDASMVWRWGLPWFTDRPCETSLRMAIQ
jgi:hypothetical protein